MGNALAILLCYLLLAGAFVGLAIVLGWRLTPTGERGELLAWLPSWLIKGVGVPVVIWCLMNVGLSWSLQPFMPSIQQAQNSGGPWVPEVVRVTGVGLFFIGSFWGAISLGWFLVRTIRMVPAENKAALRTLCWTCGLASAFPVLITVLIGGLGALGIAGTLLLAPIAYFMPESILERRPVLPIYARAIARMKMGKYNEAELEIIQQLERCEDDFDGWMMLAELYANHFRDLREAERTVQNICAQPEATPTQISVALHKLADWQLKVGEDPQAARRALELIGRKLPGTHLARMAVLRINQLPLSTAELKEQHAGKPIPLPALGNQFDDSAPAEVSAEDRKAAAAAANVCVERLQVEPNDASAREKLARLFAGPLQRPELGIEQLRLLLDMPGAFNARRIEWLSLLAAWQIRFGDREEGVRALESLVQNYPDSPQGLLARYRLDQFHRQGT